MNNATDHYLKHHDNRSDIKYQRKYEATFFSWMRHGRTGRINASKFNDDIQSKDTLSDVIDVINAFLTDENTRYETHSFASYILDGVGTVLPPDQLLLTHDRGHYSMKDWLWAKNLIPEQDDLHDNPSCTI